MNVARHPVRGALLLGLIVALVGLPPAAANPPERQEREALRVCADANNLPFTNQAGDGFENRIAELMAEELGVPLIYVWAPQVMGFVRNTLELRVCDVMIGAVAGYEFVQNTNAYYRSVYALVVPEESDLRATSLTDPALAGKRFGVVAETPPMVPLRRAGASVKGYPLMVDTRVRTPVRDAIEEVAAGETDGAVVWGPLAGHYAALQSPPLRVIPLVDDDSGAQLDYRITMGIRRGEPHWKDWINDFIERHQETIDAILTEHHVPLLDRRGQLLTADGMGGES
ncbi:quinoprotein dehydrogenase-associated putative ABC transporter substrate-binding protein [Halomonas sp. MCCC 1A11036]|uniref:Quinoprotein dehydrogenase-associated putative ABC transporter substrate-binding protein n=1 Tax=Billgrantia zhangzhouensis TaxID=2733481 RepID=A0ABS9AL56_9GAMM|nr:quinoprotein dehydrogenase-associated putative ABC transporter substrate-binding protein [Halomonas zhangzhouensis]MCE8022472.1 quinoprotein dehydrogenase-associated putative ABC transporter substrate-binding protein [Halomonas zhangzhouensis]